MIYHLDRANLSVMEILKRLTTPSILKDEIIQGIYPCQFCGEGFQDDEEVMEFKANLMLPPTNLGTRHIHVACIVDAAEKIKTNELDLKTKQHLADLDEVDGFLVDA